MQMKEKGDVVISDIFFSAFCSEKLFIHQTNTSSFDLLLRPISM